MESRSSNNFLHNAINDGPLMMCFKQNNYGGSKCAYTVTDILRMQDHCVSTTVFAGMFVFPVS